MPIGSCWGQEAKQRIVNEYNLEPIIYVKLLEGQERQGCCGVVTDKYYFFEATYKTTNEVENFLVPQLQLWNAYQTLNSKINLI